MSSATEYYGYLLKSGYADSQLRHFKELCQKVREEKMSMNKAYKSALRQGYGLHGQDSFASFVNMSENAGWLKREKMSNFMGVENKTMWYILGGIAVVGIGYSIYKNLKNK